MASATLCPRDYPKARRGGLRGTGGRSTDAKIAANTEHGFCPKNRSAAVVVVVPSARVRKLVVLPFEFVELILKLDDMLLDRRWRLLPILFRKRKGPDGVVEVRRSGPPDRTARTGQICRSSISKQTPV
jgi:hypothetical protein